MFMQVIEGHVADVEGFRRQLDVWEQELRPGAPGYLGSTAGVTAEGEAVLTARFRDQESARANSDRPEQSAWWAATEACFDGPVSFHESIDVQVLRHGDPQSARFVQVMEGHVADRDRAVQLEVSADQLLAEFRPDLLGYETAYFADGEFAEIVYFTSEEEARQAESRPMPEAAATLMAEMDQVMKVERYLDLTEPRLTPA